MRMYRMDTDRNAYNRGQIRHARARSTNQRLSCNSENTKLVSEHGVRSDPADDWETAGTHSFIRTDQAGTWGQARPP